MKIIIMYPHIGVRDAVGNACVEEYRALKEEGIEAFVYAETHDPSVRDCMIGESALNALVMDEEALLIYHHGIYWEKGHEIFSKSRCRKVIRYHNITPAHFFLRHSEVFFRNCFLGRRQSAAMLSCGVDAVWGDSHFNNKEFIDLGLPEERTRVLPPFHVIHGYDALSPDAAALERLNDGKTNVLFVGRIAPNKGHRHLIYTAFYYRLLFGENVRFIITGALDPGLKGYYRELKGLVAQLGVKDLVFFTGGVSPEYLKSCYLGSHVFLLLSEHEGFCVPILEAQHFKLPIVALNRGAVKDTLGENQLIYDEPDYEIIASAIDEIRGNPDVRGFLVDEGRKNRLHYERDALKARFLGYIRELTRA